MIGRIRITNREAHAVFERVFVKRPHSIRARLDARGTSDAFVCVHLHEAVLQHMRGTRRANFHACRIAAMLTVNGIVRTMQVVGVRSARRIQCLAAVGVNLVPPNAIGQIVRLLAGNRTSMATHALGQIDGHSVSHDFS